MDTIDCRAAADRSGDPSMIRMVDVQRARLRRRRCAWALAAAIACGPATLARAEVRIAGDAAAIRVSTARGAISDVLAAIAKRFP
jgi:hypothetical protein